MIAKDAQEVRKISEESLDEIQMFKSYVKDAKAVLADLPNIVAEALFYYFRGEYLPWPGFGEDFKMEQIREAIEGDYLEGKEDGAEVIQDDPKVAKAIKDLSALEYFVRKGIEDEKMTKFREYYEETYDHRLNFTSKRFWDTHLV